METLHVYLNWAVQSFQADKDKEELLRAVFPYCNIKPPAIEMYYTLKDALENQD